MAFADPAVGCATGRLVLTGGAGSGVYWRYEEWIRRHESLFRGVVESNAVAINVYHHAGRVLRANDAFLELVGYTRADLEAGLLNWLANL